MTNVFTAFRDWRRARFVKAYTKKSGDQYEVFELKVHIPQTVAANVRYLLAKGRPYEAEEAHFIQQVIAPGTCVIELGGSVGVVSSLIRRCIGPDAAHIIVEANPDLAEVCQQNVGPQSTVMTGAVAYTDADKITFDRGENAHTGKIAAQGAGDTFDTPVLRLSELVDKLPPGPFALVCDIEGAELEMLENEPAEIFARITHAIIELHPKDYLEKGKSEGDVLQLCSDKGLVVQGRQADVVLFSGPSAP